MTEKVIIFERKINQIHKTMQFVPAIAIIIVAICVFISSRYLSDLRRERRRDYYRYDYLFSEAWKRKRYVVLKRDNWRCVYCGAKATQVHHKKYARNIGNEPIDWLVSVCDSCHENIHGQH